MIYIQRFARSADSNPWQSVVALSIRPFAEWMASLDESVAVSGPGLRGNVERLPKAIAVVDMEDWDPRAETLGRLGSMRYATGHHDDPWTLEPIYLRPSAAEEKWKNRTG